MAPGIKGQKWSEKKAVYTEKFNTAVSEKTGSKIKAKAAEDGRSSSSVIRRVLEKVFG